jgi:hypothetical protein
MFLFSIFGNKKLKEAAGAPVLSKIHIQPDG